MYVCIYVCMYVCMSIYIYIYIGICVPSALFRGRGWEGSVFISASPDSCVHTCNTILDYTTTQYDMLYYTIL